MAPSAAGRQCSALMREVCPFKGAHWSVEISSCDHKYVYMLIYIKAKGIFVFVKTLCSSLI